MGAFDGPFALAVALAFVQFAGCTAGGEALPRGVVLNTAEGVSGWGACAQARFLWAWGTSTVVFRGLHLLSAGGEGNQIHIVVAMAIVAGPAPGCSVLYLEARPCRSVYP